MAPWYKLPNDISIGVSHKTNSKKLKMNRKKFLSPLRLSENQYRESYKFDLNMIRRGSKVVIVDVEFWDK